MAEMGAASGLNFAPPSEMTDELGTTILLVEDNEDDVFMMSRALKLAQISPPMQVVTDGRPARNFLAKSFRR